MMQGSDCSIHSVYWIGRRVVQSGGCGRRRVCSGGDNKLADEAGTNRTSGQASRCWAAEADQHAPTIDSLIRTVNDAAHRTSITTTPTSSSCGLERERERERERETQSFP